MMNPACLDTAMAMANQISHRLAGDRHPMRPRIHSHRRAASGLPRHRSATTYSLPATLQKRCEEWLALDQEPRSRAEAQQAIDAENHEILQDCMGERLAFGGCEACACSCCCRLWLTILSSVLLPCRHSRLAWLDGLWVQPYECGRGAADHTGLLQLFAGACKGQA